MKLELFCYILCQKFLLLFISIILVAVIIIIAQSMRYSFMVWLSDFKVSSENCEAFKMHMQNVPWKSLWSVAVILKQPFMRLVHVSLPSSTAAKFWDSFAWFKMWKVKKWSSLLSSRSLEVKALRNNPVEGELVLFHWEQTQEVCNCSSKRQSPVGRKTSLRYLVLVCSDWGF